MLDYFVTGAEPEEVHVLELVAEGVFTYGEELRLPGGFAMPTRAAVLTLPGGRVALHSPLQLDDETARSIDALGEVAVIVAPSRRHWLFAAAAKERYPRAALAVAPSVAEKIGRAVDEVLPASGSMVSAPELAVRRVDGAASADEHVIFHAASRSLLVSDLVFNVHEGGNVGMRVVFRAVGAWGRLAQSRAWRLMVDDRAAAGRSVEDVLAWDLERVVVGHGEVVQDDARERLATALAWMRGR